MSSENSSGKCSLPTIFRKVKRGSTLDAITSAYTQSPFSSTTPVARPRLTKIFETLASVSISAPASLAALAIALEIAPVPPRGNPQDRKAPSISPI